MCIYFTMAYLKIQIDNYSRRICKKLHMWNSTQHKKSKRETIHWSLVELNYNRISTQESLTCKLHQTSTPNPVHWQFWTLLWILVPARGHDQNLHTWIQESQWQRVCCILLESFNGMHLSLSAKCSRNGTMFGRHFAELRVQKEISRLMLQEQ